MADIILRWYIDGRISRTKVEVGGSHLVEGDCVPEWVQMDCRVQGTGDDTYPTIIDINDDDTSIFTDRPALPPYMTDKKWTTIPEEVIRADSILTLDIDQITNLQSCRDLTVQLGLRKV